MTRSNGEVKTASRTKDIALIDHAHQDILHVLEITEETKRQIARAPLNEAVREAKRLSALQDCLTKADAPLPVINAAIKLRIYWRRRVGTILLYWPRNVSGALLDDSMSSDKDTVTYSELGLSARSAQRMQDEARPTDEQVEAYIQKIEEDGERELASKEIEKMGRHIRLEIEKADWQANDELKGSIELIHQGALEYLPTIEPASIDLLLTDPPYSTDVQDVAAFARSWLSLALSRIKPSGRAYIFIGSYPPEILAYLDAYYHSQPADERHYMNLEMILPWTYRNTIGPSTKESYKLNWQACLYFMGPEAPALNTGRLTEKFSVQDINAPDGRFGLRLHPWQKPDELAERFIEHATEPGQVVLDPFAGTGTFLAAANRLGRNAIGCEIDEEMLSFCKQRGLLQ